LCTTRAKCFAPPSGAIPIIVLRLPRFAFSTTQSRTENPI